MAKTKWVCMSAKIIQSEVEWGQWDARFRRGVWGIRPLRITQPQSLVGCRYIHNSLLPLPYFMPIHDIHDIQSMFRSHFSRRVLFCSLITQVSEPHREFGTYIVELTYLGIGGQWRETTVWYVQAGNTLTRLSGSTQAYIAGATISDSGSFAILHYQSVTLKEFASFMVAERSSF